MDILLITFGPVFLAWIVAGMIVAHQKGVNYELR